MSVIFNQKKVNQLGIHILVDKIPPRVLFRDKITNTTKAELEYVLGNNIKYEQSTLIDQQSFLDAQISAETMNLNVDRLATDEDIYNSAKIALQSEGDVERPVIELFNNLISVAILRGASDIHINPKQAELLVQMRFDGNLTSYVNLDKRISQALSARIKLLSGMDITERRRPQDGRFSVIDNGKAIDIRSASMPTKFGERLTLRIFNQDATLLRLDNSGLAISHLEALKTSISKQNGLVIVCGPTGSGKTTFLNLLTTLISPTSGHIFCDDINISQENRNWKKKISYVTQKTFLTDDTIKNNIIFGDETEYNKSKFEEAIKFSNLDNFIKNLPNGINTIVGENGTQMSGGQIQRISIARALYNSPEILVFDEATNSVDEITEKNIINEIFKLKKKCTIFLVTHNKELTISCDEKYIVGERTIKKLN